MSNHPIQWGAANVAWTVDGYELGVPVWLDERASALFAQRVGPALEEVFDSDDEFEATWSGGRIESSQRGTSAEPGVLMIVTGRTLFAVPPERLAEVLTPLALACRTEADEQHARDEELAKDWIERLRALKDLE